VSTEKTPEPPHWLDSLPGDYDPGPDGPAKARDEMFRALQLFYDHVRYVITLLVTVPTAVFAVAAVAKDLGAAREFRWFAAIFLIAAPVVAYFAQQVIARYYEVYVSALIFAVRVHLRSPIKAHYPWFERTINQAAEWKHVKNAQQFLAERRRSKKDTFFLYGCIIWAVAALCTVAAVALMALK
jgi:hypothetical protein